MDHASNEAISHIPAGRPGNRAEDGGSGDQHAQGAQRPQQPDLDPPEQDRNAAPGRVQARDAFGTWGYYLVAAFIVAVVSYIAATKWYGTGRTAETNGYVWTVESETRTGDAVHVTVNYHSQSPPSTLSWGWRWCSWFFLYVLVMNSAPRILVSAGEQLRIIVPPGSLFSPIIWSDELAGVIYAGALGFVAVGLNNVMMRYLYGSDCDLGTSRVYLPFKNREDVKVAARAWGSLMHKYLYVVAALVKSGVRPVMSTLQYVALGLTVAALCAWDLLSIPCVSNTVFRNSALYILLLCECLWLWGCWKHVTEGNKDACVSLVWHLLVLIAVWGAPV